MSCARVCVSAYMFVTDKPIMVKVLPEPVCPLQRRDRMQVSKSVIQLIKDRIPSSVGKHSQQTTPIYGLHTHILIQ